MRDALAGLCIGIILLLNSGFVVMRRQDSSSALGSIFRTRCAARCLSLHSTRIALSPRHFQNNGSLGWCQSHKQCAKCLEPCKDSWELKDGPCRDLCEHAFPKRHGECVTSCEFLRSVMVVKQGDCPAPERASGFAAACVEGCEEDGECSAQKKCCPNGCGHTCQSPKNLYRGAPLKPRKELVFEELESGVLEVRWSSKFNVSAEPVLNVLQRRWNYGIHPSEDGATEWQVVARTSEERVWLTDIRPGRWYQFRVAAVNVHGTRGYTTPSRHFRSSKDPAPPPAPSELHVSDMTFGADRSVSVRLSWSMSADLDIPVNHYKLSWSCSDHTMPSKLKRRQTTNGDSTYAELDDLRENRSYTVELQAVSYWGQVPLKSSKAIFQFTTSQRQSDLEPTDSPVFIKPQSDLLDVGTPFYQDGQLQVRVYWKKNDPTVNRYRVQWSPEFCSHNGSRTQEKLITQENFASLPGLQFSCKYKVIIQPVGSKSKAQAESTTFYTPSCATIQSKSPKPIPCSTVSAVVPPKVLVKAENLTAAFSVYMGNVTGLFSWVVAMPQQPQQVTGYQVTWAEVITESRRNHLPNSLISQSQILPPEHNILVVSGLQLASLYRLEVQVITAGGQGPATSRTFQTPAHSKPVLHYKPRIKKHHLRSVIERH
ncbi:anosmin-1-like isoform X1 [Sinocyclocheilus anshuiensis]|uniref:anosmin-1-like isoform X1 n=1 Tax=Sinocyclocheilus anshuiensis TaxID=1608454 RepID=UPI0007B7D3E6|nr:PREDICTED: anosmin-1-like isoform X1 [Sinocyclocheilus anshuiensis]